MKLDDFWAKLVKKRDKCCILCGTDKNLQAHHIISRIHNKTRWVLDNGVTLCSNCHNDYHSVDKNKLNNHIGKEKIAELKELSIGIYKEKKEYTFEKLKAEARINYNLEL